MGIARGEGRSRHVDGNGGEDHAVRYEEEVAMRDVAWWCGGERDVAWRGEDDWMDRDWEGEWCKE